MDIVSVPLMFSVSYNVLLWYIISFSANLIHPKNNVEIIGTDTLCVYQKNDSAISVLKVQTGFRIHLIQNLWSQIKNKEQWR